MRPVICPLCGARKARRACPALGHQICAVCCGTKRLTEIQCPSDCPYLASAREHPPAALVRQHQSDLGMLGAIIRDFNRRQSQLFVLVATFLVRYESPALQPLIDDDVAEAAAALASTFETASRGLIYDHRPRSVPAERLVSGLKPLLDEAGKNGGSSFERDTAVVLRRFEEAVRAAKSAPPAGRRAFLDQLARFMRPAAEAEPASMPAEPSRLIVP